MIATVRGGDELRAVLGAVFGGTLGCGVIEMDGLDRFRFRHFHGLDTGNPEKYDAGGRSNSIKS
jgi:hypothetical protein